MSVKEMNDLDLSNWSGAEHKTAGYNAIRNGWMLYPIEGDDRLYILGRKDVFGCFSIRITDRPGESQYLEVANHNIYTVEQIRDWLVNGRKDRIIRSSCNYFQEYDLEAGWGLRFVDSMECVSPSPKPTSTEQIIEVNFNTMISSLAEMESLIKNLRCPEAKELNDKVTFLLGYTHGSFVHQKNKD